MAVLAQVRSQLPARINWRAGRLSTLTNEENCSWI